jgi:hypothetical protein
MALLAIWEFSEIVSRGGVLIGRAPGVLQQPPVNIGGASTLSQPFNAATAYVRLHCDTSCCIAIGTNPVAVQPGVGRMATNQTEYFGVNPGDSVAVIATT